jgi:integrase
LPRRRKPDHRGLPARWVHQHGAYYFRVPKGLEGRWDGKQMFRLAATLPLAYKVWAERLGDLERARTIGQLLDRYALEVIPTKAPKTQTGNTRALPTLRAVLGHLPLSPFKPRLVYQYVDRRGAKIAAHREIEVLSHAFTKAVEWGYIDRHPFKGEVRLEGEPPRTRYVEDWEVVEALAIKPRRKAGSVLAVQAYIRVKLLTGMRRADLLRLRPAHDCKEDGIHVQPRKTARTTGKRLVIEWSAELRAAVEMALAARPVDIAPYLFCTRRGECYAKPDGSANGWESMWGRFMERLLAETKVEERFTEHDLRAKCASDAGSLEHARALLAHADARTTERVYRRKPERVKPLR